MKITKRMLKQLIQEELRIISEKRNFDPTPEEAMKYAEEDLNRAVMAFEQGKLGDHGGGALYWAELAVEHLKTALGYSQE